MDSRVMGRRRFLQAAGLAGTALAAGCGKENEDVGGSPSTDASGTVDADAISFVSVYGTSGTQAELGQEAVDGLRLAATAADNTVDGRPFEVVTFDTQEKIDEAIRRAREADADGAEFFFGGLLSNVALAVGEEVNDGGGVFVTGAGADEITGAECREGVFRWSVATYGAVHETVKPLITENPSLKRWYTITPEYVFGESLLAETKNVLAAHGGEHVGNSYHGLDATEFSGYVNNAAAAEPDVLCLLNFGAQATTTITQAVSFGLKENMTILLVWGGGLSQLQALGADTLQDIYVGAQYWHTADTPGNQEFVDLFQQEFDRNPSYAGAVGYATGRLVLAGIERSSSTEPADVVAALEGLEYDGLTGPETVRAEDHQVMKEYYLTRGKAASDMTDPDDFVDIVTHGDTAIPVDQAGCTLQPLTN